MQQTEVQVRGRSVRRGQHERAGEPDIPGRDVAVRNEVVRHREVAEPVAKSRLALRVERVTEKPIPIGSRLAVWRPRRRPVVQDGERPARRGINDRKADRLDRAASLGVVALDVVERPRPDGTHVHPNRIPGEVRAPGVSDAEAAWQHSGEEVAVEGRLVVHGSERHAAGALRLLLAAACDHVEA